MLRAEQPEPGVQRRMAQLPPPQQREYRKRLMAEPYREPLRVSRADTRAARLVDQSAADAQYRPTGRPADPRQRLGSAPGKSQPQLPQAERRPSDAELRSTEAQSPSGGIRIIARRPTPASYRRDADGGYGGQQPDLDAPSTSSTRSTQRPPLPEQSRSQRPLDGYRPPYDEVFASDQRTVEMS